MSRQNLQAQVIDCLAASDRPLSRAAIAQALDVDDEAALRAVLDRLFDQGRVHCNKRNKYALPSQFNLLVGRLDATKSGAGFVVPETSEVDAASPLIDGDLYVPPDRLGGAVHGDKVVARVERSRGRPAGSIIRVLERAREQVVGTLNTRGRGFGFVAPDAPRLGFDVYVPADGMADAGQGDKVVVAIDRWPSDEDKSPEGHVVERLGPADAPGVDTLAILKDRGLDEAFPPAVQAEAERLVAQDTPPSDDEGRRDLRGLEVFTIDPADARDLDDALSIERLDDHRFRVGVHIADVSHYVRPDTMLDEEARRRGTSVYLVDRVVHMLPAQLSADVCSLLPGVDRRAFSLLMTLDGDANVLDFELCRSTINSRLKLSYPDAQALIRGEPRDDAHRAVTWPVQTLRRLAKQLQRRRSARGSLDFDLPDDKVVLDDEGVPVDVRELLRLDSMRLVEEFMILANETVAGHLQGLGVPAIYRVHASPEPDSVDKLRRLATALGLTVPTGGGTLTPEELSSLAEQVRGTASEDLFNVAMLRAMQQAQYQVENIGHFGLGSVHYTHFTSPIRRYPDLETHRILAAVEGGARWKRDRVARRHHLAELADHCSRQARTATDVERASVDLKKTELMAGHVGETFSGNIVGVAAHGFFVRIDRFAVEGRVAVHDLDDDHYRFDEDLLALVGRNHKRRFRIGDRVIVRVAAVRTKEREIDLELVEA